MESLCVTINAMFDYRWHEYFEAIPKDMKTDTESHIIAAKSLHHYYLLTAFATTHKLQNMFLDYVKQLICHRSVSSLKYLDFGSSTSTKFTL